MPIQMQAIASPKKFDFASRLYPNLRGAMDAYLREIRDDLLSDYENVDETPGYERRYPKDAATGVGGGWRIAVSGDGTVGVLTNVTKGAEYVQGSKRTELHESDGWRTVQEVKEEHRDEFREFMQDALLNSVSIGGSVPRWATQPRIPKGQPGGGRFR